MVGAVRDAQDPVDLKKLGRGERKLQAEEKEAQRVIWKLQQLADGHAGGGVPELDTLKSLTPSELKLLATKCGEQGLDRTHTAIAHSLFWWIQSCGGVSFAVSIGVGRVWTGPSRKPAKAVEAPCCKPAKPRAQACLVNGLPPAPRRRSTVPKGLLLALPNASASTSSGSPALHGAMRAEHGEAAQALLRSGRRRARFAQRLARQGAAAPMRRFLQWRAMRAAERQSDVYSDATRCCCCCRRAFLPPPLHPPMMHPA